MHGVVPGVLLPDPVGHIGGSGGRAASDPIVVARGVDPDGDDEVSDARRQPEEPPSDEARALAIRAFRHLTWLAKGPLALFHAYSRSCVNGWITSRRMGGYGPCRFRCGDGADTQVHYASCRRARKYFCSTFGRFDLHLGLRASLGLDQAYTKEQVFMLAAHACSVQGALATIRAAFMKPSQNISKSISDNGL